MTRFFLFFIALLALSGCGAYFVSTGDLKAQHQEDLAPTGLWATEEMQIVFFDGPEASDHMCVADNGETIKATVHALPSETGVLIVLSDLLFSEGEYNESVSGELIYGMQAIDERVFILPLFANIDEADTLPFASQCAAGAPKEETLAGSNYTPFCLSPTATVQDIVTWAAQQEDIERTELRALPDAAIPEVCQQN